MDKLKDLLDLILKNGQFIKYQPIILPSASGLICLILLFFVAVPQFLKLQSNQKDIKEIETKTSFYKHKEEALSQIEPETYKSNISAALAALPDDRDIPGIIGQIQSSVAASGMSLDSLSFTSSSTSNTLNNYYVRTQVTGDISGLKSFIAKMQQSARVVKLSQLDISGGASSKVQANLDFITYFQPLPNIITNIDQQVPLLSDKDKDLLDKIKNSASATTFSAEDSSQSGPGKVNPFK